MVQIATAFPIEEGRSYHFSSLIDGLDQKKYFKANCMILGGRADESVPKRLLSNVLSWLPVPLENVSDGWLNTTLLVTLNASALNSSF
jgi:hypothetical protein